MKIGVYTIAKNESIHVKNWLEACKEADFVCVADTGSTDDTVALLETGGAEVHHFTKPFRFDEARNFALEKARKHHPDILLSPDLDEYPVEGWRERLEAVADGNNGWRVTLDNGSYSFRNIRAHRTDGWEWKHACHEILCGDGPIGESEVRFSHHQNIMKPRNYLPLLEMDAEENPKDGRAWHYLGREYMYLSRWEDCIKALRKAFLYDQWPEQKAMGLVYSSRAFWHIGDMKNAKRYAYTAVSTWGSREAWVHLAWLLDNEGDPSAKIAARNALDINKKGSYPCEPSAWAVETEDWLRKIAEAEQWTG